MKTVNVDIGGKLYEMSSDDIYLENISGGFEPDTVKLLRCFLRKDAVVLDIGANIGCTALLFADEALQVFAFEPSPSTFEFLTHNVRSMPNVEPVNLGIGDTSATMELTFGPQNRSGGFVSNQTKASAGHTIESIQIRTLDETVADLAIPKVDFIKIDVEGFEGHVLRGASRTLKDQPVVVLEMNHWCLNAFQRTSIPDFLDQLRSTFPILLAVDGGSQYLDLHDPNDSYVVMYHHILHSRFANLVGAFDEGQLVRFRSQFTKGFKD